MADLDGGWRKVGRPLDPKAVDAPEIELTLTGSKRKFAKIEGGIVWLREEAA